MKRRERGGVKRERAGSIKHAWNSHSVYIFLRFICMCARVCPLEDVLLFLHLSFHLYIPRVCLNQELFVLPFTSSLHHLCMNVSIGTRGCFHVRVLYPLGTRHHPRAAPSCYRPARVCSVTQMYVRSYIGQNISSTPTATASPHGFLPTSFNWRWGDGFYI